MPNVPENCVTPWRISWNSEKYDHRTRYMIYSHRRHKDKWLCNESCTLYLVPEGYWSE